MPKILVAPLSAVPQCIRLHAPSHLVTLLGPEYMIETPEGIAGERHLRLAVNDIVEATAGELAPTEQHVRDLLAFTRRWNRQSPLLVHCWAGISRSMAATFTILCDQLGPDCERHVAMAIRARAPHADPNRLFVRLADQVLGRSGRMMEALDAIGRGKLAVEGYPVEIPLVLEGQ
jgi:predicted protein tyrosine phosphatase